ncbi:MULTISPECIES: homoserine O-acetyltransferase [unclassified Iodidimonas]|jgi:homoserine O-acetyltransferase|uniref:homoserine O-acetyltransferase MetX n=1 Tax=unclassified Iodidimonas TaxID=2626145 RepID=UPI0024821AEC|nr:MULTISPECIES: homoserine O-acetyltransferase [unclassified Iodidimonas]
MTEFSPPKTPPGHVLILGDATPLPLDSGGHLGPFPLAYSTYGTMNAAKSNVILIAHALTGDQVVSGTHPVTKRPGWWDRMVGPGRIIDTNRFFVICANVIGGCMGSAGPAAINPATGQLWSADFPFITIGDMVRAQARLLDHLGIDDLFMAIGGSMGGMQVLQWLRDYPQRLFAGAALATAARHSPQQIGLHSIGRRAILADPHWQDGRYHGTGHAPIAGLEVARMLAHLSYRAPEEFDSRFGRTLQDRDQPAYGPGIDYQVENYLAYHGRRFVERFDPASYILITKAMDYFDLAPDGDLAARFVGAKTHMFLGAYESDWLYPPAQTQLLADAMARADVAHIHRCYQAIAGHDSFLLEIKPFDADFARFINEMATKRGLPALR